MTTLTAGRAIVAPYRDGASSPPRLPHEAMLDALADAIDLIVGDRDVTHRLLLEAYARADAAEKLAAERLDAVLAAADFAARIAKELKVDK